MNYFLQFLLVISDTHATFAHKVPVRIKETYYKWVQCGLSSDTHPVIEWLLIKIQEELDKWTCIILDSEDALFSDVYSTVLNIEWIN